MFTPPSRTYNFICDLTIHIYIYTYLYIYRQTSYGPLTLPVTATSGCHVPRNLIPAPFMAPMDSISRKSPKAYHKPC